MFMEPGLGGEFCALQNVTYDHRVFDPEARTWCPVPDGGADVLLFGALAVFVGCALYSRLSAVWALAAGALFALLSNEVNLNHFSNALTLWLGMRPTFLFFEVFLPPLLLDSALRLDFFLFKKLAAHTLMFAGLNVVVSTLAFIPVMLYGLNLAASGWGLMDAALFGAMLGSTDAVAVAAILKAGGAPELLSVLLEGESLFNDASSILLFQVFLKGSLEGASGPDLDLHTLLPTLVTHTCYLTLAGAACGVIMGMLTRLLFKLLHKRHVPPHVEVAAVLAGSYTVYLCTEYYVDGSGVIAVVVYGLYGAATYQYGLSSKGLRTGALLKFFDVLSYMLNAMVFFYVGSSIVNFFVSLSGELFEGGSVTALLGIAKGLPVILAAMFLLRGGLIWLEAPLLSLLGPRMSWQEVLFSTAGGLRGGLALILVQTVVAAHSSTDDPQLKVVHAQMALWVSGVVLFTLTVNAPLLGPLMNALGLNKTTPLQRKLHRGAYAAVSQYTRQTIADLRVDDDEMLKGVDWRAVRAAADLGPHLHSHGSSHSSKVPEDLAPPAAAVTRGPRSSLHDQLDRHHTTSFLQPLMSPLTHSPRNSTDLGLTQLSDNTAAAAAAAEPGLYTTRGRNSKQFVGQVSRLGRSGSSRRSSDGGGGGDVFLGDGGVGGMLRVPLLSRIASRGRERYGPDAAGSDDEGGDAIGDVESGQNTAPTTTNTSNSEAFFIASRLQQQDQQLAQHTATADNCPFLNLSIDPSTDVTQGGPDSPDTSVHTSATAAQGEGSSDASAAAAAAGDGQRGLGYDLEAGGEHDHAVEGATAGAAVGARSGLTMGEVPLATGDRAGGDGAAPSSSSSQAPAVPAAAGVTGGVAELAQLQPLITVCVSDLLSPQQQSTKWPGGMQGHSAADGPSSAAAAVAATAAAMAPTQHTAANSRFSFIAAANGASTAAGGLGLRPTGPPDRTQVTPQLTAFTRALPGASLAETGVKMPHDVDDAMSDMSDDEGLTPDEYLQECRTSLLAGLKRHFRFKAAEGLLSRDSLRLLEYACDAALSRPGAPLSMWKECGCEIRRWGILASVASLHLQLRRQQAALLRQSGGCVSLRVMLSGLLNRCSQYSRKYLGKVAVTALEVALELWLALTVSPVAKLMRGSATPASALLQEELRDQAAAVWRFIMDRQLEAPDEFAALQTHRVKLAVARRQLHFAERMAKVGAVDEATCEELQELLERRLHRLESRGPSWQNPGIMDVLRSLPCLAAAPEELLLWMRAYGELRSYQPGQCIIPRRRTSPPGVFIVLLGLVRVDVERPGGRIERRFVGVGGSVGIVPSVIRRDVAGFGLVAAYAQGNALGNGPMVLHLPMRLMADIRQRATPAIEAANHNSSSSSKGAPTADLQAATAAGVLHGAGPGAYDALGSGVFAQLLLDMHRQVGVMLLERMSSGVVNKLLQHLVKATQAVLLYATQLPQDKALAKLQRLMLPLLVSSSSPEAENADLAQLIAAALETATLRNSSGGSAVGVSPFSATPATPPPPAAAAGGATTGSVPAAAAAGGSELSEEVLELLLQRAVGAAGKIRDIMRGASLVTLAPGQRLQQAFTIFVLKGSLRLDSSSSSSAKSSGQPAAAAGKPTESPSRRGLFRGRSQRNTPNTAAAAAAGGGGSAGAGGSDGKEVSGVGSSSSSSSMRQFNAPALLAWGPELFGSLEDRYESHPQHATAGPTGALLLVTRYAAAHSSSGTSSTVGDTNAQIAAAGEPQGKQGTSQPQQQQQQQHEAGSTWMCSRQLLERTIAPAVELDETDV